MPSQLRGVWADATADNLYYGQGRITPSSVSGWTATLIAYDPDFYADGSHGWSDFCWSGDKVYVFYVQRPASGYRRLKFSMSNDGGVTWSAPQVLYDTEPNNHAIVWGPRARVNSAGRVFCAFVAYAGTNPTEILLVYSDDDFSSQSTTVVNTYSGTETVYSIALAIQSNDIIHITYPKVSPKHVYHRRSMDDGASFGSEHQVSVGVVVDRTDWYHDMVVDSAGNLHVISPYDDNVLGYYVVGHWSSLDIGDTWSYRNYLDTTECQGFRTMRLATRDNDLYAWWQEKAISPAQELLYYSHSGDLGATWDSAVSPDGGQPYIEGASYNGGGYAPDSGAICFGYITEERDPGAEHVGAILSTDGINFTFQSLSTVTSGAMGKCSFKIDAALLARTYFMLA